MLTIIGLLIIALLANMLTIIALLAFEEDVEQAARAILFLVVLAALFTWRC